MILGQSFEIVVGRVTFIQVCLRVLQFFSVITSWKDVHLLINVVGRGRNWLLNSVRSILYTKTWCKPTKSFIQFDSIFASSDLMYVSTIPPILRVYSSWGDGHCVL